MEMSCLASKLVIILFRFTDCIKLLLSYHLKRAFPFIPCLFNLVAYPLIPSTSLAIELPMFVVIIFDNPSKAS